MDNDYYFDSCTLDNSQDEEITLDNWKPTPKSEGIIHSEWRQKQIGNNFNQEPGIDELKKIEMYVKKKKSDADIMKAFGINAETLVAIKKNKYCPIDGISLDNLSKIYAEFKAFNKTILRLQRSSHYLAKILFIDKEDLKKFQDFCKTGKETKEKKLKIEELDISSKSAQGQLHDEATSEEE